MLLFISFKYINNLLNFMLNNLNQFPNSKINNVVILKPKAQFRHVIYYSLPNSIRFIVKKRLNFLVLLVFNTLLVLLSIL